MQVERGRFYAPENLIESVSKKAKTAEEKGTPIDYLTFVPDGEPTLDANLGCEIDLLKTLGIKVAVITNGSLVWRPDVKEDLMKADWVSLKFDSIWKTSWRRINRPHRELELDAILSGMLDFSGIFPGELVTETMLVTGLNNDTGILNEMAEFLQELNPARAYLSIPTRPPAEHWALPPAPEDINSAFQVFSEKIDKVEYLIGYEGNAFAFLGNVEKDLLSITSVHPMRESAVSDFLRKAAADWSVVHKLIEQSKLVEAEFQGQKFYLRNFTGYGPSEG